MAIGREHFLALDIVSTAQKGASRGVDGIAINLCSPDQCALRLA